MKKITYVMAFAMLASTVSFAQEYKKFKVGVGLGYAMASGSGSSGGVLFAIEPAYRLKDNISIGIKLEDAVIVRGFSQSTTSASLSAAALASSTFNGQYYFGSTSFRPFVGLGCGLYQLASVSESVSSGGSTVTIGAAAETKLGFYPRIGFDNRHFNVTIDYNIIPSTDLGGGNNLNNSYIGFRVGAFFGGGKK
ncbi:MAG TPA: outer membrane beta-barrel protein [Cyclobacteriaceae bacterium]|jgi:outer membrane protein W|nr:outer membrane beta-barrel protein [Cyclobacteriaceae bacterium]